MTKKDYYENDTCPFADNCTSKGIKCMTCKYRYKKKGNHYYPWPNEYYPRPLPWRCKVIDAVMRV